MKFFIDTANADEIKKANEWGVLDGVTTNPSLIAKEGVPHKKRVLEICEIVGPGKPVSAECVETEFEPMLAEARDIATWHPNIYVKVPMTPNGMEVIKKLTPEGVKFNCTLIFSLPQALIAAKAGASFISFFVGRIDDIGSSGVHLRLPAKARNSGRIHPWSAASGRKYQMRCPDLYDPLQDSGDALPPSAYRYRNRTVPRRLQQVKSRRREDPVKVINLHNLSCAS
jgi:hypothetical protein